VAKEDDDAWRAIVDNYGERPEIEEPPPAEPEPSASEPDPQVEAERTWDDPDSDWETDRFVPPPPPPLPTTTPDRRAAWAGVFGSPAILLVCLLLRIDVPELLAYALVAAFVGGFVYLVLKMTREPRDPDDDGAVL
jgi:hypothetical protein